MTESGSSVRRKCELLPALRANCAGATSRGAPCIPSTPQETS